MYALSHCFSSCMVFHCMAISQFIQQSSLGVHSFYFQTSITKESTCNAEDPGLIPGSGRSTGEGIGYPLQYSWASLVAQLAKNPPAMREIWV